MKLVSQKGVIRKAEARTKKRLYKDFVAMGNAIAKQLEQLDTERGRVEDIETTITLANVKTRGRLTQDLLLLYRLGPKYIKKISQEDIDLEKINLRGVKWVQDLQDLNTKNIAGSILHTHINETKETIALGVFEGKTYKQIGQEIIEKTKVGYLSPARAERIAINTVGNAYEQGRYEAIGELKNQGMRVEKMRSTVGDNRVSPGCADNEAKGWIQENEAFPSGDIVAPRAGNPRCRCTTNYEVI